ITVLVLLLFPPCEFVLTISHNNDRLFTSGRREGLGTAVTVASLGDYADDFRQRGKDGCDRLLGRSLIPVPLDAVDNLEFRMFLDAFRDPGMDRVVDRSAGQTADL